MQNFNEWKIKNSFRPDTEIYFLENTMIGLRHENEKTVDLPGRTVYRVVDNDEKDNTVVITDKEGNRYKFDQNDLAKALAEDSAHGFQALQYPVGYLLATSSSVLSQLSIFDPRLKDPELKEKDVGNIFSKKNKK